MDDSDPDQDLPPAHLAAAQGDTTMLVTVIKQDPTLLEQQDADGLTPLGHAVMAGQLETMKKLVKMGASINTQDNLGRTCLAIAAYQGWYDGVMFLLRSGAKQTMCDKAGRTPLHAATYDTDNSNDHSASRTMSLLLQTLSVQDINQKDNEGMTALHWSSFHNRPEHVQLLLAKGADIFVQDIDGKTALHWAGQNGSIACCTILLKSQEAETLVNIADNTGKTTVHFAAAAGHAAIIKELAAVQGCDIQAEDPDKRTPLHWAAATGQVKCVSMLVKLGAAPDPLDAEGGTPLDYARQSGHQGCVDLLESILGVHANSKPENSRNGTANTNDTNINAQQNNNTKGRKNPFGFIFDLFKSNKKNAIDADLVSERSETFRETSTETSGLEDTKEEVIIQESFNQKPDNIKKGAENDIASNIRTKETTKTDPSRGNNRVNHKPPMGLVNNNEYNQYARSTNALRVTGGRKGILPPDMEEIIAMQRGVSVQSGYRSDTSTPRSTISTASSAGSEMQLNPLHLQRPLPPPVGGEQYQLGPIKGSKPKLGYPPGNRTIASLLNEQHRTPTPPAKWDDLLGGDGRLQRKYPNQNFQNNSPASSPASSLTNVSPLEQTQREKRKTKKKKHKTKATSLYGHRSVEHYDIDTTEIPSQPVHAIPKPVYGTEGYTDTRHTHSPPDKQTRNGSGGKASKDYYKQLDRSIQNLLH